MAVDMLRELSYSISRTSRHATPEGKMDIRVHTVLNTATSQNFQEIWPAKRYTRTVYLYIRRLFLARFYGKSFRYKE